MNWKKKLSSRKFWAAITGVVISVMVAFNADAGQQEKVTGIITATGTLAIYMLAEGGADKAAAKKDDESEGKKK